MQLKAEAGRFDTSCRRVKKCGVRRRKPASHSGRESVKSDAQESSEGFRGNLVRRDEMRHQRRYETTSAVRKPWRLLPSSRHVRAFSFVFANTNAIREFFLGDAVKGSHWLVDKAL